MYIIRLALLFCMKLDIYIWPYMRKITLKVIVLFEKAKR